MNAAVKMPTEAAANSLSLPKERKKAECRG